MVTADGAFRGAKDIPLKAVVDEALPDCPTVRKVIVLRRTGTGLVMQDGRDAWWDEEMGKAHTACPAEEMDAEDMLFILYTSGSTGKPKGVVHTTAGYMVYADYSFRNVFQYNDREIFWCTADIGWITGHTYLVYGPLLAGATTLMFEGVPTFPDAGRFWAVIDKYRVENRSICNLVEFHHRTFLQMGDTSGIDTEKREIDSRTGREGGTPFEHFGKWHLV